MFRTILFICLTTLLSTVRADHYVGGSITYVCLGNGRYEVALDLYLNCDGTGILAPPALHFDSGCGDGFVDSLENPIVTEISGLCPSAMGESTCNGGVLHGVEQYHYTTIVELGGCPEWTINWRICCRASSANLFGTMGMYVEARLDAEAAPCNSSPVFGTTEIPYLRVDQPFSYNFGVTDPDSDSLRFALIDARYFSGTAMPVFYVPGLTGAGPIAGTILDPATGLLTFTAQQIGKYCVVLQATSFNAAGDTISTVMRDVLFIVLDHDNDHPDVTAGMIGALTGPASISGERSITVCPTGTVTMTMEYTDPDVEQALTLVAHTEAALPGATWTVSGTNPATMQLTWDATDAPAGLRSFTVTATDDACPFRSSQSYTYEVDVLPESDPACSTTGMTRAGTPLPFRVFPDPSDGRFTLMMDGDLQRVDVIDMTGRTVYARSLAGVYGLQEIVLPSKCGAGTYLLRCTSASGSTSVPLHVVR